MIFRICNFNKLGELLESFYMTDKEIAKKFPSSSEAVHPLDATKQNTQSPQDATKQVQPSTDSKAEPDQSIPDAQVAYEAFIARTKTNQTWDTLTQDAKRLWASVAKAVTSRTTPSPGGTKVVVRSATGDKVVDMPLDYDGPSILHADITDIPKA